jgi:hypothetical protein
MVAAGVAGELFGGGGVPEQVIDGQSVAFSWDVIRIHYIYMNVA